MVFCELSSFAIECAEYAWVCKRMGVSRTCIEHGARGDVDRKEGCRRCRAAWRTQDGGGESRRWPGQALVGLEKWGRARGEDGCRKRQHSQPVHAKNGACLLRHDKRPADGACRATRPEQAKDWRRQCAVVQTDALHWGSGFVGLAFWHGGFSHFVSSVDSRPPVVGRVGRMVRHGSTYNWPVMQHAARDMVCGCGGVSRPSGSSQPSNATQTCLAVISSQYGWWWHPSSS